MKIIYFSPFSFIYQHSFPEAGTIKSLIDNKHNVARLACDKTFINNCVSMKSVNLDINSTKGEKEKICKSCMLNSKAISKIKGLKTFYTSNYISQNELNKIDEFVKKITINSFNLNSTYQGANLNKISMYDLILKFKLNNLKLNQNHFYFFKNELRNSLISYTIGKNFLSNFKAEKLIIYSPQYSINNAFLSGYKHKNLKIYLTEGSNNFHYKHNLLRFWDWEVNGLVHPAKKEWPNYEPLKLPRKAFKLVKKHVLKLNRASSPHIYSTRKTIFFRKKIFDSSKYDKIALLNMSSSDESYAAYVIGAFPKSKVTSFVFNDQIEWIKHTINFFTKKPNFGLIIRIHPRETINKRDKIVSQHMDQLFKIFSNHNLPENIKINWPQDKVSFYDLIKDVDILIAKQSITVIESLYHNKPVVIYDNELTNYPNEIVFSGKNIQDYEKNIIKAFNIRSSNLKIRAEQWWAFNHYLGNLSFKKSIVFSFIYKVFRKIIYKYGHKYLIAKINGFELNRIQLDKNSEQRLVQLLENNYTSLLDKRLDYNKKYIK